MNLSSERKIRGPSNEKPTNFLFRGVSADVTDLMEEEKQQLGSVNFCVACGLLPVP
jgi:hypothetical protein